MRCLCVFPLLLLAAALSATAVDYPAAPPGRAEGSIGEDRLHLCNSAIRCEWTLDDGRGGSLEITNRHTDRTIRLAGGCMPRVVLAGGGIIDLSQLEPLAPFRLESFEGDLSSARLEERSGGKRLAAAFEHEASGLRIGWSAELRDGSNYVIELLELRAEREIAIESIRFIDAGIAGAGRIGEVSGSVVVRGGIFLAAEHPLAENSVSEAARVRETSRVRCELPRGNTLRPGQAWRFSAVIGAVPEGQLRRGFLHYLERRRAHPYRPFLHYNSWYHLNISRPDNRMTEAECLQAIEDIGRELVAGRDVELDAFVWDDGWDDFDSLWGFHDGFTGGFAPLASAARKYGAAQGVWMSPWGGYGKPHEKRIAFGRSQDFETNARGFSMAGPRYHDAFRTVCLKMMRDHGVVFFKFDGMGGGNYAGGAREEQADDIDAMLRLTRELRSENPDLFISATVGTWPSPFWLLFADSVWRQGGDTGFHGPGDTRQQWITYRDMHAYQRIVCRGPLFPLNSVMFHGLCIGERANPARMSRDEKSVADEIWTMFGCGMGLQELYITPHLLTEPMWDELAKAAKWARACADVLVDSHWIGGDPGAGEAYGFAAWHPGRGVIVVRNPAEKPQSFPIKLAEAWELPEGVQPRFSFRRVNAPGPGEEERIMAADASLELTLEPFEVIVLEGTALR